VRPGVHEDPWILDAWQVAQDLRQLGGAELAGSTRAVRVAREPNPRLLVRGLIGHPHSPG